MNQFLKSKLESEKVNELKNYGFQIQEIQRRKPYNKGQLLIYEDEICELLKLIEITGNAELWQVHFCNSQEPSFILI